MSRVQQGIAGEAAGSRLPEVSPYAELSHAQLIGQFYETEGDTNIGRELSDRLFRHAGLTIDPNVTPLLGRDGKQIQEGGASLTLTDYVNYAAGHHFEALEGILDFLLTQPGDGNYEAAQAAMLSRLNAGRR